MFEAMRIMSQLDSVRLRNPDYLPEFVVGGPCICFAKGRVDRLTLQDLVDCVMPAVVAGELGVRLRLYFQSHEADLMAAHFDKSADRPAYPAMQQALLSGVRAVLEARSLPVPDISIIDTSEPAVRLALDEAAAALRLRLAPSALYGLYKSGSVYPRGCPEEPVMLDVYYRNIALYTSTFFEALDGRTNRMLIVENNVQTKAIETALGADGGGAGILLYEAACNRQGKEMNTGNRNHKIELRSTPLQVRQRAESLTGAGARAADVYRAAFGNLSLSEVMRLWTNAVEHL